MARPMTMAEKILAAHAGLEEVVPGLFYLMTLPLLLQLKNSRRLALIRYSILPRLHLFLIIMFLTKTFKALNRQNLRVNLHVNRVLPTFMK